MRDVAWIKKSRQRGGKHFPVRAGREYVAHHGTHRVGFGRDVQPKAVAPRPRRHRDSWRRERRTTTPDRRIRCRIPSKSWRRSPRPRVLSAGHDGKSAGDSSSSIDANQRLGRDQRRQGRRRLELLLQRRRDVECMQVAERHGADQATPQRARAEHPPRVDIGTEATRHLAQVFPRLSPHRILRATPEQHEVIGVASTQRRQLGRARVRASGNQRNPESSGGPFAVEPPQVAARIARIAASRAIVTASAANALQSAALTCGSETVAKSNPATRAPIEIALLVRANLPGDAPVRR